MRGFREGSKYERQRLGEIARSIVSKEAQGFLYASFFGALVGSISGSILAFALGAWFY